MSTVTSTPTAPLRIPAIDVAPARSGDPAAMRRVADAVAEACRRIGFLVISGHGIPQPVLDAAFERGYAFFGQPAEIKALFRPAGPAKQRGYHTVASRSLASTLGVKTPHDLRESYFFGPLEDHRDHYAALPEAATSYAPNVMPTEPPGAAEAFVALYRAYERLSLDLLRIFAVALEVEREHFTPLMTRHFSILGIHHYPALETPPEPGQLRAGAHTDFGAMTILAMDAGRGGLEVKMPDGRWEPVLAGRGELVVNLGDMMERWTNGRWVSTLHRVATPTELKDAMSRRMSIGYFVHPNYDAEIRCFASCLAPSEAAKHPTITAGEHILQKIERSHAG